MTHEFASFLKNYIDTLPVSYKLLGFLFGVDGELLEHQYRDHLGSYMSWSQLPHAEEWILFERISARMWILMKSAFHKVSFI